MRPMSRVKPGMTVRRLLRERLTETQHSTTELAEAVEVPAHYVTDLVSGRRRPPLPSRTDLYDRMTRFLRMGRNELADCAAAERAEEGHDRRSPCTDVRDQILELCNAESVDKLKRRARTDDAELVDLMGRVLDVAQTSARRSLDAQVPLRIAATRAGANYPEMRLRVLEFLDTSPATLTLAQLTDFVRPHIALWDVDLESGALRVVLRSTGPTEQHARRPVVRTGRAGI